MQKKNVRIIAPDIYLEEVRKYFKNNRIKKDTQKEYFKKHVGIGGEGLLYVYHLIIVSAAVCEIIKFFVWLLEQKSKNKLKIKEKEPQTFVIERKIKGRLKEFRFELSKLNYNKLGEIVDFIT